MRVVLLSDTSKEFPENTSSAFKVRLPKPLQLEDGLWEVDLSSVSLPDAGFNLDALTDDRTANLIKAAYLMNEPGRTGSVYYHRRSRIDEEHH